MLPNFSIQMDSSSSNIHEESDRAPRRRITYFPRIRNSRDKKKFRVFGYLKIRLTQFCQHCNRPKKSGNKCKISLVTTKSIRNFPHITEEALRNCTLNFNIPKNHSLHL